ncbi:MAG: YafY family transcriptional regulator [Cellulosilyticum sp.]|nr:YafY family transcriptional regulator [Cellulosilyticum sp.]
MKIDRLIGIITLLLQHEKMTAPELATRFEVSRRTINRDIEDICKAGIPLVTMQGINGGISIMDSYKVDKTLLTEVDMHAIITGLSSLDSVSQDRKYQNIIEKFSASKGHIQASHGIQIDLASHYKETLAPKIELIKESIECKMSIRFNYFNKQGQNQITLDPYIVVFKWSNWYVFGYSHNEEKFRLYKLNRIETLASVEGSFRVREIPEEALDFNAYFTDHIKAVILFEPSEEYRLIEEYGRSSFTKTKEGKLYFSFPFTNESYLLNWVLSFGDRAELLEPKELRPILKIQLQAALNKYN